MTKQRNSRELALQIVQILHRVGFFIGPVDVFHAPQNIAQHCIDKFVHMTIVLRQFDSFIHCCGRRGFAPIR